MINEGSTQPTPTELSQQASHRAWAAFYAFLILQLGFAVTMVAVLWSFYADNQQPFLVLGSIGLGVSAFVAFVATHKLATDAGKNCEKPILRSLWIPLVLAVCTMIVGTFVASSLDKTMRGTSEADMATGVVLGSLIYIVAHFVFTALLATPLNFMAFITGRKVLLQLIGMPYPAVLAVGFTIWTIASVIFTAVSLLLLHSQSLYIIGAASWWLSTIPTLIEAKKSGSSFFGRLDYMNVPLGWGGVGRPILLFIVSGVLLLVGIIAFTT